MAHFHSSNFRTRAIMVYARRSAYTLMELLLASATASVLLGGMASSVYVASQALDITSNASAKPSLSRAIDQIVRDLRHAKQFSEQTATAMTFTVPDRDEDGQPETIRYAWGGVDGDPLTYELNGQGDGILVDDVTSIDFTYVTRVMVAEEFVDDPLPTTPPVFEEYTEEFLANSGTSITVDTPLGTSAGDLLVTAIAVDKPLGLPDIPTAPTGWNAETITVSIGNVQLNMWWKIATASEPDSSTFNWLSGGEAYAWTMRFTGHDASNPIHQFDTASGTSATPTAPAVSTTVDNCMVVRLGAFDDDDITTGVAGVTDHLVITMEESGSGNGTCSGGAAYATQADAGDTGAANFVLTASEQFVTATIAIAPEPTQ